MKYSRIIMLSLLVLCTSVLRAQEEETRPVREFTPKAGDFGFSISANPLTQYLGRLFNGATSNTLTQIGGQPYLSTDAEPWNDVSPMVSISGKYMITDKWAARINVGWIYTSNRKNMYTTDDAALAADPFSQDKVVDSRLKRNSGGSFSVAGEYRVGSRRVQGVFGGGLLYAFNYQRTNFQYGNAITDINQNPSTAFPNAVLSGVPGFDHQRMLNKFTKGAGHNAGLVAFVGIEWFVAPNISLGGEVNVAAVWNWTSGTYYKAEGYNTISGKVEEWTELLSPSSSGFTFGTGNVGANLSVNFYF